MQTDLNNESVDEQVRAEKMKLLEVTFAKSDLSRKMQELLGVYLLFER